ncbi:hypothetical protein BDW59DRAFT_88285 [Aspergillus cavernicola]|uniref:Uncharacterized protein n=1 Tax=Aspergillus cavernicola TaxID=176166 RepID=A0ABR4I8N2_9EURO
MSSIGEYLLLHCIVHRQGSRVKTQELLLPLRFFCCLVCSLTWIGIKEKKPLTTYRMLVCYGAAFENEICEYEPVLERVEAWWLFKLGPPLGYLRLPCFQRQSRIVHDHTAQCSRLLFGIELQSRHQG